MRKLSTYPGDLRLPVEIAEPLDVNPACGRCDLRAQANHTVCMKADGRPGGLLIVSDYPGKEEDRRGRPMVGKAGQYLRNKLAEWWDGPVAFDNALRCLTGGKKVSISQVETCRGYLAQTLIEAQPQRVLLMGGQAYQAVLGRSPPVMSSRKGYAFLSDGTPVFLLMNPAAALRNRFVREWFEEDLRWALSCPTPEPKWDDVLFLVETEQDAQRAVENLYEFPWVCFDTETAGIMYDDWFQVYTLAASGPQMDCAWVWDEHALQNPKTYVPLKALLEDPEIPKAGWNIGYDIQAVHCGLSTRARGKMIDGRLLRKILFTDADGYLESNAELVGMGGHKDEAKREVTRACQVIAEERKATRKGFQALPGFVPRPLQAAVDHPDTEPKNFAYGMINPDIRSRYCALDTISTAWLCSDLGAQVQRTPALQWAWQELVQPAIPAVAKIEEWGMHIDEDAIRSLSVNLGLQQEELANKLMSHKGGVFDPDSPHSTRKFLYSTLGLSVPHATEKGSPSVDKEALQKLKGQHPVIEQLIDYRLITKMKGTFVDGIRKHIRADGRLHPSLDIAGARTGRLSCSQPPLHQIPRTDTETGKLVKNCFTAPDGHTLVAFDFSQLELRIAALLSGDPLMIEIFAKGIDYHQRTAEMISEIAWSIKPHEVTRKHRSIAKTINFSTLYGSSPVGLVKQVLKMTGAKISLDEAQRIQDAILSKFHVLRRWIEARITEGRRTGLSWTEWEGNRARRRQLWRIADSDDYARSTAEHGTFNTPVQGGASDFCLKSLVRCVGMLEATNFPAKIVITVHDSLIFEVPTDLVSDLTRRVVPIMTDYDTGSVPLIVDASAGPAWGSLADLTLDLV